MAEEKTHISNFSHLAVNDERLVRDWCATHRYRGNELMRKNLAKPRNNAQVAEASTATVSYVLSKDNDCPALDKMNLAIRDKRRQYGAPSKGNVNFLQALVV